MASPFPLLLSYRQPNQFLQNAHALQLQRMTSPLRDRGLVSGFDTAYAIIQLIFFYSIASEYVLDASSSDFYGLADDGAFVDKSLALQDFLEDRTPVHLLLRPRRSGKTILLKMFR